MNMGTGSAPGDHSEVRRIFLLANSTVHSGTAFLSTPSERYSTRRVSPVAKLDDLKPEVALFGSTIFAPRRPLPNPSTLSAVNSGASLDNSADMLSDVKRSPLVPFAAGSSAEAAFSKSDGMSVHAAAL